MPGTNIQHFGAFRIRVVGQGNLIVTYLGYDNVLSQELVPIAMNATDFKERTRLANFTTMAAKYKVETRKIDEVFKINDVTLFSLSIFEEYPNVD